jgi:CYTH domain-containing protein
MPLEIERKFLVSHDDWKSLSTHSFHMRDGLVTHSDGRKVRVRICDREATLTVKGKEHGLARAEFEYAVPVSDAEEMLRMCEEDHLEKMRHVVPHAGVLWQVDVYEGTLRGIVIAEIELKSETQQFDRPDWIGREVTNDANYRQFNMLARRNAGLPAVAAS